MKKTKVKMNNHVYIGLLILDISNTLMYEFWYNCVKPKYQDKVKLCYMDTDNFIIHSKTEDFYKDIADDLEKRFDTSNCDEDDKRPVTIGENKKVIGLFKGELGGKIILEFIGLRIKTYAYYMDDDSKKKKSTRNKKVCDEKNT